MDSRIRSFTWEYFFSGFDTGIPAFPAICEMSFFNHQKSEKTTPAPHSFGVFAYVLCTSCKNMRGKLIKKSFCASAPLTASFWSTKCDFLDFLRLFAKTWPNTTWGFGVFLPYFVNKCNFLRRKIKKKCFLSFGPLTTTFWQFSTHFSFYIFTFSDFGGKKTSPLEERTPKTIFLLFFYAWFCIISEKSGQKLQNCEFFRKLTKSRIRTGVLVGSP